MSSMNTTIVPWILWDIFFINHRAKNPSKLLQHSIALLKMWLIFFDLPTFPQKNNLMTSYLYYICSPIFQFAFIPQQRQLGGLQP